MKLDQIVDKVLQGVRNIVLSEVITKIEETKQDLNQKIDEFKREANLRIDNINIRIA